MEKEELKESLLKVLRLLDKGIAMERNARDFYSHAARLMKSQDAKDLFEWLAGFEVGHKKRLESKWEEIRAHEALKNVDVPSLGQFDVSEAAWKKNFPQNPTETDILLMAIENEKRAYSFFEKKITFTKDELLLEMLKTLAREEIRHLKILEEQYKRLKMDNIWGTLEEVKLLSDRLDDKGNLIPGDED